MFFDISRYLRGNNFDIVWGYHPPGNATPKYQFFERLILGCQFFLLTADTYLTNILTWFGGTPKNQFFDRLNLGC